MAMALPPALATMSAVSVTVSALSAQTTRAPSRAKSREAARPMPLPAPVITAVRPSRRPMEMSLLSGGRFGAADRGDDGVDEDVVEARRQVGAHAGDDAQLRARDGGGGQFAAKFRHQGIVG